MRIPRDILVILLAEELERQRELVANLVIDVAGNADTSGLGLCLQSGSNVHPVSQQVAALYYDIAQIDPNPKSDLACAWELVIAGPQRRLHLGGAAHGVDGAAKFRQDRVPCGIKNAPAVKGDERFENLLVRPKYI